MKKIITVRKRKFRYDSKNCVVECIAKATHEMKKDNEEWQSKFGANLWDIDPQGYIVLASAGLAAENWNDCEARTEYLEMWSSELDEEDTNLVDLFMMDECKEGGD